MKEAPTPGSYTPPPPPPPPRAEGDVRRAPDDTASERHSTGTPSGSDAREDTDPQDTADPHRAAEHGDAADRPEGVGTGAHGAAEEKESAEGDDHRYGSFHEIEDGGPDQASVPAGGPASEAGEAQELPAPGADSPERRWRTTLSPEELDEGYRREVREFVFGDRWQEGSVAGDPPPEAEADKPTVFFVGGPPGTGKSRAMDLVKEQAGGDVIQIEGDALRPFHPDHHAVMAREPHNMTVVTGQAAGEWTKRAISDARTLGLDVAIEGTLRNPSVLLDTARDFGPEWRRELHVVAEPPEVSRLGTVSRVLTEGRHTPGAVHDEAYRNNPDTIRQAFDSGLFDRITLSTRNGLAVDCRKTDTGYEPDPGAFMDRLAEIRQAPMAAEKARDHMAAYYDTMDGYFKQEKVDDATLPSLNHVTGDAYAVGLRARFDSSERVEHGARMHAYELGLECEYFKESMQSPEER
ncbi:zeta toxin family protein [Streptomyces sp. NPDC096136]|uniref:zeta toxin family protein n=1 Tax=Streptomyces sp. NPDC096136 TaxID=3366076 RepID=UPI0037FD43A4